MIFEVTTPEHGTVTNTNDGRVVYVPDQGYIDTDEFGYSVIDGDGFQLDATVTVEVTPVNDAPVASEFSFDRRLEFDLSSPSGL